MADLGSTENMRFWTGRILQGVFPPSSRVLHISPIRINGSAVETLFSQFRFTANAKLSSVNYAYAVRAFRMKKLIHGSFAAARGQRDIPLFVQESGELKRKK